MSKLSANNDDDDDDCNNNKLASGSLSRTKLLIKEYTLFCFSPYSIRTSDLHVRVEAENIIMFLSYLL